MWSCFRELYGHIEAAILYGDEAHERAAQAQLQKYEREFLSFATYEQGALLAAPSPAARKEVDDRLQSTPRVSQLAISLAEVLRLRETTCYNLIADDALTAEILQLPPDTPADLDFYLIAFYDAMSFLFRALYKVLESQRLVIEDPAQPIASGSPILSPAASGPLFARIRKVVVDQLLKLFQADEPRNLPEKLPVSDHLRRRLEKSLHYAGLCLSMCVRIQLVDATFTRAVANVLTQLRPRLEHLSSANTSLILAACSTYLDRQDAAMPELEDDSTRRTLRLLLFAAGDWDRAFTIAADEPTVFEVLRLSLLRSPALHRGVDELCDGALFYLEIVEEMLFRFLQHAEMLRVIREDATHRHVVDLLMLGHELYFMLEQHRPVSEKQARDVWDSWGRLIRDVSFSHSGNLEPFLLLLSSLALCGCQQEVDQFLMRPGDGHPSWELLFQAVSKYNADMSKQLETSTELQRPLPESAADRLEAFLRALISVTRHSSAAAERLQTRYQALERLFAMTRLPVRLTLKGRLLEAISEIGLNSGPASIDQTWQNLNQIEMLSFRGARAEGSFVFELLERETQILCFPYTEALFRLLERLLPHIPRARPDSAAPGLVSYAKFGLRYVLQPWATRQYSDQTQRWRIVDSFLGFFLALISALDMRDAQLPTDTEQMVVARTMLRDLEMEVRQDSLRALLRVLVSAREMDAVVPAVALLRDQCLFKVLSVLDTLLVHMEAQRNPQMANLLITPRIDTRVPEFVLHIIASFGPEQPADLALVALKIFCRLFAQPSLQALGIYRTYYALIDAAVLRRANMNFSDDDNPEETHIDLVGGKHASLEKAGAFVVLQFLVQCLHQQTLTVGHLMLGFDSNTLELSDLRGASVRPTSLLGAVVRFLTEGSAATSLQLVALSTKLLYLLCTQRDTSTPVREFLRQHGFFQKLLALLDARPASIDLQPDHYMGYAAALATLVGARHNEQYVSEAKFTDATVLLLKSVFARLEIAQLSVEDAVKLLPRAVSFLEFQAWSLRLLATELRASKAASHGGVATQLFAAVFNLDSAGSFNLLQVLQFVALHGRTPLSLRQVALPALPELDRVLGPLDACVETVDDVRVINTTRLRRDYAAKIDRAVLERYVEGLNFILRLYDTRTVLLKAWGCVIQIGVQEFVASMSLSHCLRLLQALLHPCGDSGRDFSQGANTHAHAVSETVLSLLGAVYAQLERTREPQRLDGRLLSAFVMDILLLATQIEPANRRECYGSILFIFQIVARERLQLSDQHVHSQLLEALQFIVTDATRQDVTATTALRLLTAIIRYDDSFLRVLVGHGLVQTLVSNLEAHGNHAGDVLASGRLAPPALDVILDVYDARMTLFSLMARSRATADMLVQLGIVRALARCSFWLDRPLEESTVPAGPQVPAASASRLAQHRRLVIPSLQTLVILLEATPYVYDQSALFLAEHATNLFAPVLRHRPRKLTSDAMEELYLVCSYVRLLAKQSLLVKGTPTVDIDGRIQQLMLDLIVTFSSQRSWSVFEPEIERVLRVLAAALSYARLLLTRSVASMPVSATEQFWPVFRPSIDAVPEDHLGRQTPLSAMLSTLAFAEHCLSSSLLPPSQAAGIVRLAHLVTEHAVYLLWAHLVVFRAQMHRPRQTVAAAEAPRILRAGTPVIAPAPAKDMPQDASEEELRALAASLQRDGHSQLSDLLQRIATSIGYAVPTGGDDLVRPIIARVRDLLREARP